MKPSKSGRLRIIIGLPHCHDTEWPEAPRKTPSPGRGWLRRVGGSLGQSKPGSPALHSHTTDGSPRVVDRTVEPFLVFGGPCPAAFWSFRCPPGSGLALRPPQFRRLSRFLYPLCASLWPPIH